MRDLEGTDLFRSRRVRMRLAEGRIARVEDLGRSSEGPFVAPGLVDLQIGGARGESFNTDALVPRIVGRIGRCVLSTGTTTYLPNVTTNDPERITDILRTIAAVAGSDSAVDSAAGSNSARIGGIHLEGPFISGEDGPRGAHDVRYVRPPDWDLFQRWQKAANGLIRLVTLAPEWPGSGEFITRASASGVLVAIGHTAATPQQIRDAIAAGARLSTHLGNGSHVELPRHDNYLWEQLAADELTAALIADGAHLPDAVLRVMLRAKGERAFLVSDSSSLTGFPPGDYRSEEGRRVRLTGDGRLVLADQPALLAGSVRSLADGVAHVAGTGLATWPAAWSMASTRPAGLLGLSQVRGLTVGAPADLVVFEIEHGSVRPRSIIRAGVEVDSQSFERLEGKADQAADQAADQTAERKDAS